jgi:hypothetical protein
MARPLLVTFEAGESGEWLIDSMSTVVSDALPDAARLTVHTGPSRDGSLRTSGSAKAAVENAIRELGYIPNRTTRAPQGAWRLSGTTSNVRYTTAEEGRALAAVQEGLGRPPSTRAALVPIRKTAQW